MNDRHADTRDRKRAKSRYGMRVNNKAAHLHEYIVKERAERAKADRLGRRPDGGCDHGILSDCPHYS